MKFKNPLNPTVAQARLKALFERANNQEKTLEVTLYEEKTEHLRIVVNGLMFPKMITVSPEAVETPEAFNRLSQELVNVLHALALKTKIDRERMLKEIMEEVNNQ